MVVHWDKILWTNGPQMVDRKLDLSCSVPTRFCSSLLLSFEYAQGPFVSAQRQSVSEAVNQGKHLVDSQFEWIQSVLSFHSAPSLLQHTI